MTPEPAAVREKLVEDLLDILDGTGDKYLNWEKQLYPIANALADFVATYAAAQRQELRAQILEERRNLNDNWRGEVDGLKAQLAAADGALADAATVQTGDIARGIRQLTVERDGLVRDLHACQAAREQAKQLIESKIKQANGFTDETYSLGDLHEILRTLSRTAAPPAP